MLPFEREIYMGQAMQDLERRRRAAAGGNYQEIGEF